MVEYLTHNPKIIGLNPAILKSREKMAEKSGHSNNFNQYFINAAFYSGMGRRARPR